MTHMIMGIMAIAMNQSPKKADIEQRAMKKHRKSIIHIQIIIQMRKITKVLIPVTNFYKNI